MKSCIKNTLSTEMHTMWSDLSNELRPLGPPAFKEHYWSLPVDHVKIQKIRLALEKRLGHSLKHRNESHITLITPPEWAQLQSHPSNANNPAAWPEKINNYQVLCLAESKISPQQVTYYLVIRLEDAQAWREHMFKQKNLRPPAYFPHITVGFINQDLHLKDGVRKDQSQCLKLTPEELNVTL